MIISAPADSIEVAVPERFSDWESLRALAGQPVSLIGDCLQRMGMMDAGISPVTPRPRLAGAILPVLCREGDNLAIHRAIDEIQRGDVLVVNGRGDLVRAVFGSILAEAVIAKGAAGVIVDGAVRDADELAELPLPVYARGVTPAGPYKTGPGSVGLAVACGGVVCASGDAVIGDSDGVIVIPGHRVGSVVEAIQRQLTVEEGMRERIAAL